MPALKVENLAKTFPLKKPLFGPAPPSVRAVRSMSFAVETEETLGVWANPVVANPHWRGCWWGCWNLPKARLK